MIPKKIHYCWFGGNPLPELALKCIASWEKYCPDYEIIRWDETNYDVNKCQYTKEAYENKKWAFVSDYARMDILYQYGGLYFDTDVELIKSIEDIVDKGPFMGIEMPDGSVNPGLGLGAEMGMAVYKKVIDKYETRKFILENGEIDQETIVSFVSGILYENIKPIISKVNLIDGISIYPKDYFCPLDYETGKLELTPNTRSIHHYTASWQDPETVFFHQIKAKMVLVFGEKYGPYFAKSISIIKYRGFKKFISEFGKWRNTD